jgi:predicted lactoylglutathione lyase
MSTKIFVNLPVKDLNASIDFFTKLGFSFDLNFTDENATSMVNGDDIYVMLMVEPFFRTFTKKDVVDATKATETIVALGVESRARVDEIADAALASGGSEANEANDQGFMYGRSFNDLDGHLWEVVYMDESAIPA